MDVKFGVRALALLLPLGGPLYAQPKIGNCAVFPANNVWNAPVDHLPVAANSATLVGTIGRRMKPTLQAEARATTNWNVLIGSPSIAV